MRSSTSARDQADPPDGTATPEVLLRVKGLDAGYGKRQVLSNIDLNVGPGEIVGVLGHNGAGKTTLLKCLFRSVQVRAGTIEFDGVNVNRTSSVRMVRTGMSFTPAETPIFRDLTVRQNLELGAVGVRSREEIENRLGEVYAVFPVLSEREKQVAGHFSGGQQRQLSLGIALMARPRLMLLDEPSLGISPSVVDTTFAIIRDLVRERSMSVVIVEQNVKAVTSIVDRVYVLRNGAIVLEESGEDAQRRDVWWDLF